VLSGETSTWEDVIPTAASPVERGDNRQRLRADRGCRNRLAVYHRRDAAGEGALPAGELSPTAAVTIVGEDGEPVATGEPGEIVVEVPAARSGTGAVPDLTESVFSVMPSGYRVSAPGTAGDSDPTACSSTSADWTTW